MLARELCLLADPVVYFEMVHLKRLTKAPQHHDEDLALEKIVLAGFRLPSEWRAYFY